MNYHVPCKIAIFLWKPYHTGFIYMAYHQYDHYMLCKIDLIFYKCYHTDHIDMVFPYCELPHVGDG